MICDYVGFVNFDQNGKKIKLYRPILGVSLIKRGFKLIPVGCLLDSGADTNIFPIVLARLFGLDYKKGNVAESNIAGGGVITFYEFEYKQHGIDIFFNDARVKEKICFSEGQRDILLGQDFFRNFVIKFDRKNKKFSID